MPKLLTAVDPAPFNLLNEDSSQPYLLVCEHAGQQVPQNLDNLGLPEEAFSEHYAVDIGARAMTEQLADKLGAPAIVANYSRAVIDLNRRKTHPSAFPSAGEGTPIPRNLNLSEDDKEARIADIYDPFHNYINDWIEGAIGRGVVPAIISIHSYTPVFFGQKRPWEIGVLWVQDPRIPVPIMEYFKDQGYVVGDNEPYDARILRGGTMEMHADNRKIPNCLIEYRNDLLTDAESFADLLEKTAQALSNIMQDETIYSYYDGPEVPYDPEAERRYMERFVKTMAEQS